ncbi:MAG: DUF6973 domain-containing protein [Egibacteraceae bacterium]
MAVSSADPDDLDLYVNAGRDLNESSRRRAGALTEQYDAYAAAPSDYPVDVSGVLRDLVEWIGVNGLGDQWVRAVAQAFRQADTGGGPVTMEDARIAALLRDGGMPDQPPSHDDPLADILATYQVADEEMVDWEPPWPASLATDPESLTRTEAQLLNLLSLAKMRDFRNVKEDAIAEAQRRYSPGREPTRGEANDGHLDAFRHAYWNALMAREFGQEFARKFANAHEGVTQGGRPVNPADREAMDLYNNEVGRRIAAEHPDASPEELADLVEQSIERGDMVVIDRDGELAYSDQVRLGEHGQANDPPQGGGQPAERGDSGDVNSRGAGS